MYLLLASMYWWTAWDISSLVLFSTVNNLSSSVNRPNSTFVFLKLPAMLVLSEKKTTWVKFICFITYFESFQIHQRAKVYPFDHINHGNHFFFFHFKFFPNSFHVPKVSINNIIYFMFRLLEKLIGYMVRIICMC